MTLSYVVEPSNVLPVGTHETCQLTKVTEEDGKFGRQLVLDFTETAGLLMGRGIRAWASLSNERGPIVPTPRNRIGRFLLALTGRERIEKGERITPEECVGQIYAVEVAPGGTGGKVEGFVLRKGLARAETQGGAPDQGGWEEADEGPREQIVEAAPGGSQEGEGEEASPGEIGPQHPTALDFSVKIAKAKTIERLRTLWTQVQEAGGLSDAHRQRLKGDCAARADIITQVLAEEAAQISLFKED